MTIYLYCCTHKLTMVEYTNYETARDFLTEHIDPIDDEISGDEPDEFRTGINDEEIDWFVYGEKDFEDTVMPGKVRILENGYGYLSEPHKDTQFYHLTDEQMKQLQMLFV